MNAGGRNNESMKTTGGGVTCTEFQDQLPELFESGADERAGTSENLRAMLLPGCLEYIAQQAKLLLPARRMGERPDLALLGKQKLRLESKQNEQSQPQLYRAHPSLPVFHGRGKKALVGRMLRGAPPLAFSRYRFPDHRGV